MRTISTWAAMVVCSVAFIPRANAAGPFDGVYRGEPVTGTGCSLFTPVLRVSNGEVTLRYNPTITFDGTVDASGSLEAPHGKDRLSGKFTDGKFQGGVSAGRCQYPLDLHK